MKNTRKVLTLFILLLSGISIFAQIIPPENRIDWNPGIPGGILNTSSWIQKNVVVDFGADNTGASDALAAIQSGIDALPNTNQYVLNLPAGTYRMEGSLKLKDNMVVRGVGLETKLEFYNPDDIGCISILLFDYDEWQDLAPSAGYAKGSSTLTVPDASLFEVGGFVEIKQTNTDLMNNWEGNPPPIWGADLIGQLLEVSAIENNVLTFKTSLHFSYSSASNPKIRRITLIKNIGIEDLFITLKTDTDVSTIDIKNAAYCWVKNVTSYKTNRAHVNLYRVLGSAVVGAQFSHSYHYGGGGHGYGVAIGLHASDILVENNSFDHLRHSMLFIAGASGNVYGYNYSQRVHGEDAASNYIYYPADISAHGLYSNMNLLESNSANDLSISDAWGTVGPGNTFFRNFIKSNQTVDGFTYWDKNTLQNVIGNSFIKLSKEHPPAENNLEHGNVIDGETVWDPNIASTTLPTSYYLAAKPAFLGSKPWPLYGPNIGFSTKLPAEENLVVIHETNIDEIIRVRGPRVVTKGETINLEVDYYAKQDRKLHIAFGGGDGVILAGCFEENAIAVPAGHGTVTCTIVVPESMTSGGAYSTFLSETNGPAPFWQPGNYFWKLNQYDVTLGSPLPVELKLFTAVKNNTQVNLAWQTAQEMNNSFFTIERSADGKDFRFLGQVESKKNTSTPSEYKFEDESPLRGINYYRLTQTDIDGQSESFEVASVSFDEVGTTIYPTLVHNMMTMNFAPKEISGQVVIFNLMGQKVFESMIEPGATTMALDASSFSSGPYFIQVMNGGDMETLRFVKE